MRVVIQRCKEASVSYDDVTNSIDKGLVVLRGMTNGDTMNDINYLGYQSRYSFVVKELPEEMHPTKSCYINVSGKTVGLFGQVHPRIPERGQVLSRNTHIQGKDGELEEQHCQD